ncbi:hypothetical protein GGS21DRAFT_319545 [Xylaria nigripes]|nr:hypothetical protein GGS21DRAFT_319545 [Xylaria nigripes]
MAQDKRRSDMLTACQHWLSGVGANLRKTSIWQPMLKNTLSTTIAIMIAVIPTIAQVYGKLTFLGAMASVFGQPGQRFGKMVETLSLIVLGTLLGLGWSNLGLHLSSLVYARNHSAAWAIRALFFTTAVIIHGVLRSSAPRLFQFVFFFILINLLVLTSHEVAVTLSTLKAVIYPIFTAIGVVILVNVAVFPNYSSSFLGTCTIETLTKTINSFQMAGDWFMSNSEDGDAEKNSLQSMRTRFAALTSEKTKLRACLSGCKAAQAECNFELVLAVLPPVSLKPISVSAMTRLVQVTIGLINACESKFALAACDEKLCVLDKPDDQEVDENQSDTESSSDRVISKQQRDIDLIKPIHEIESGDIDVLEHIMAQIRRPAKEMFDQIRDAVQLITSSLAYCYDVSKLPSGSPKPRGILLWEVDIRMEIFTAALTKFDVESAAALEAAADATDEPNSTSHVAPRMETHLAASFLISISQAARHVLEMQKHVRILIERRQRRHNHLQLYWPHISWKKWLVSGGEQDSNVLPENARKEARAGYEPIEDRRSERDESAGDSTDGSLRLIPDEELGTSRAKEEIPLQHREGLQRSLRNDILWIRGLTADAIEFFLNSDHLKFALKMTIAALIVTLPAFVPATNEWYNSVRGTWATLQLILVFEVSVGTSLKGFFLRAVGAVCGCTIGLIAWEIGQGNRVALVIILALGILPGTYVQVATPYVKAGLIAMISLSVVGITTVVRVNDDLAWQTYVKRLICFLVGGTVALLVEMIVFPVRARDMLVESLASTISQTSIMQSSSSVAAGIDSVGWKTHTPSTTTRAKEKAEQALDAARTFLPFCLTEPRIKGTFKGQQLVYREMIYVLSQIIERMDNMAHIRKLFGSTVLEELHTEILPYRRNLTGCVTLTFFAVQEALITKLPLPQFLPSSRVAVLRYVARTRELVLARGQEALAGSDIQPQIAQTSLHSPSTAANVPVSKSKARQGFLAWKASSAGMIEIVEYLEELVDLAKLLVGVNAFRSGLLERRKLYEHYALMREPKLEAPASDFGVLDSEKTAKSSRERDRRQRLTSFGRRSSVTQRTPSVASLRRLKTVGTSPVVASDNDDFFGEDDIPWSLPRIIAKRVKESDRIRPTGQSKRKDYTNLKGKNVLRNVQTA